MRTMKNTVNRIIIFSGLLLMLTGGLLYLYESNPQVYNTLAEAGIEMDILDSLGKWEGELTDGKYYRLVNEEENELDQTAHEVFVGDEFILEDNNRYKVVRVDNVNHRAVCEQVGAEEMPWDDDWDQVPVMDVAQGDKKVGIYMTHTGESYVPTDGAESQPGRGGILEVGKKLAGKLQANGVDAEVNLNKHDPHDANAYHRSRKTAVQLLRQNPLALIDVHRDGIPDPGYYATNVDGQNATKIRLVVGRQNPHMSANLEFAKQVKGYFDKTKPGLIKGIYMGKGNYNQDLGPRAMLIEVGTYTNSRTAAEAGVAEFANGIPRLLGVAGGGPAANRPVPSTGAGTSLLWILLVLIIGGGAFLLLSTGSWKESLRRITTLGKEFSNYLGPIRSRRKKDDE